jgi:hypothetical protein
LKDFYCFISLIVEVYYYYHGSSGSEATANLIYIVKVSEESSLAGRVKIFGDLPYDRFLKAYWPRQLYLIREESLFLINRNIKSTLHL